MNPPPRCEEKIIFKGSLRPAKRRRRLMGTEERDPEMCEYEENTGLMPPSLPKEKTTPKSVTHQYKEKYYDLLLPLLRPAMQRKRLKEMRKKDAEMSQFQRKEQTGLMLPSSPSKKTTPEAFVQQRQKGYTDRMIPRLRPAKRKKRLMGSDERGHETSDYEQGTREYFTMKEHTDRMPTSTKWKKPPQELFIRQHREKHTYQILPAKTRPKSCTRQYKTEDTGLIPPPLPARETTITESFLHKKEDTNLMPPHSPPTEKIAPKSNVQHKNEDSHLMPPPAPLPPLNEKTIPEFFTRQRRQDIAFEY